MKYFIDCGTHLFQGLRHFNDVYKFDENWFIYSFEANPMTYELSKNCEPDYKNLIHLNKAIWTNSDGIYLNVNATDTTTQGSNILEFPPAIDTMWGTRYAWDKKIRVESIDLSSLIYEIRSKDEFASIHIKMDIEGAEFDVLQKILEKQAHRLIDTIYVEFHERFFIDQHDLYRKIKEGILSDFRSDKINILEWE